MSEASPQAAPTLLFFTSKKCPLCQRLDGDLRQVGKIRATTFYHAIVVLIDKLFTPNTCAAKTARAEHSRFAH